MNTQRRVFRSGIAVAIALLGVVTFFTVVTAQAAPCEGKCWQADKAARTLVWTGPQNGMEDIHLVGSALDALKSGFEATFTTTVPGTVLITDGTVDGTTVAKSATGIEVRVGTHKVTSTSGFRWTPAAGYGWRKEPVIKAAAQGTAVPPAQSDLNPMTHACPPDDGVCWSVFTTTRTIVWYGSQDGSVDIHQGSKETLQLVRSGYTAKFTTTVPGRLIAEGYLDGIYVLGDRTEVPAGQHVVTGTSGFRWSPNEGEGWRIAEKVFVGGGESVVAADAITITATPEVKVVPFGGTQLEITATPQSTPVPTANQEPQPTRKGWLVRQGIFGLQNWFWLVSLIIVVLLVALLILLIIWHNRRVRATRANADVAVA